MPRSKFHAIKTVIDGITFASKAEAKRYLQLKDMLAAGEITELELQVPFDLIVTNKKTKKEIVVGKYLCDFQYLSQGERIVEDVKGVRTAIYSLKKKILFARDDIRILETPARGIKTKTKK